MQEEHITKLIEKLKKEFWWGNMRQFAVVGVGRFGESLALTLMNLGHEVIVIDKNEDIINKIAPYVTYAVSGDITNTDVLKDVGIHNVSSAIVSMGNDLEASVLATLTLKEIGVETVIAKAKSVLHSTILKKVGADEVIIPEYDMGRKLAHNLATENVVEFYNIEGDYAILEIVIPKSWIGNSIAKLDVRAKYGINILGVARLSGEFIGNPEPSFVFEEKDKVVLFGTDSEFKVIQELKDKDAKTK